MSSKKENSFVSRIDKKPEIVMKKTHDLKPYLKNSRTHDKAQVALIAASIKEFGFINPILLDGDNGLIAGAGRLAAAVKLSLTTVPCIELTHLSAAQKRAYVIADNQIALRSGWDDGMLKAEMENLMDDGFDLTLLGFDSKEFDAMMGTATGGETDEDEAPEPPKVPVSKLGDQWLLGDHRLRCGDSTKAEDVDALLAGGKVDLVFTDPPYGVSIGDKNAMLSKFRKGGIEQNIEADTLSPEKLYVVLLAAMKNAHRVMNDCAAIYVCSPQGGGLGMMMMMMKDAGLEVRHVLNWIKNKPTFSLGRLDYDYQHEPILFTWKKTHKKNMGGEHKTSCWFIDKPTESKLHPTMKPVAIPENAILNSSSAGDIVLDLFGGAGSTLIACEKTKRKAYLMELDGKYCDVIVNRWMDFTGKTATLEATGASFHDVARDRKRKG